jgi:hypothetical protein
MELKEIGPVSSAKVLGVFYAAIGLIAGVIIAFIAMAGAAMGNGLEEMSPFIGGMFGLGAIVLLPVLYGLFGALAGLIFSGLYNVIARLVGGIQVTLQ